MYFVVVDLFVDVYYFDCFVGVVDCDCFGWVCVGGDDMIEICVVCCG